MPPLTADRDTPRRENAKYNLPVGAAQRIFAGAIVCRNATGFAVRGAVSTTLVAVGRAEQQVDNSTGADGAARIDVVPGVFRFRNSSAADQITLADVGNACFIADDDQVARTNGTSTRSQAGIVRDVDSGGVWVEIGGAR
jgi:hypothetical protein